jgi:uncharacterized caspase-like protein
LFFERIRPAVSRAVIAMSKRLVTLAAAVGGLIFSMILSVDAAWADKRVALVVGNSSYLTVPKLPNPSRDADSVAKMFRDAGFDSVDVQLNVGNLELKRAIRKFEATADQADIAVIYYAGHGLEISGTNYLIPTDARLVSDRDAEDEAIPLERLVASADGARKLRVVILDACRDNPFTVSMRRERKSASRAVSPGLGKIEPTSTDTLIAYAAKAGSTADDGDGEHSPFTTALLKNLTVPGLDIRLAFGRIRDDVMKSTASRQEPFVYGSLGGGNISLVPPPVVAAPAVADDGVKADYDLVARIGSRRAWEVFLGTYKTGFYSDLARAQMASLTDQVPATTPGAVKPVSPETIAPGREQAAKEALDWDRVRESTDQAALRNFIKRYPDSPLAINAQQRIDVLKRAAQERDDRARIEREAAQKAAEEARVRAEQQRAEIAAAKKREADERRAKAAEAEQKARAAAAERKAAEAKQKAEEAERTKAAEESAKLRAESERQAKQAEAERKKAEQASALEATCKDEQGKFDALLAKGSEGAGIDEMKALARTAGCDRLKPQIATALDKFAAEAARRAATLPNAPELVRAAQTQLVRLGCMAGKPDGILNPPTKAALGRYLAVRNQPPADVPVVTEALVTELTRQTDRACPLECKTGEIVKGDICVSDKPAPSASRRKDDDEDETPARRKPAKKRAEREQRRPAEPRARQQASRPSGGGGGGHTMIGVGF